MERKLGRLPARQDSRTLFLSSYLRGALPAPPATIDWTEKVKVPWGMMANDKVGDCAICAPAHQTMVWTANTRSVTAVIADQQILAAYSAVSGYNGTPRTDVGCVLLDVMKFWRGTGIGGHTIDAFVSVKVKDVNEVKTAVWLFGGVILGVDLPLSAQDQLNNKQPWLAPTNPKDLRGRWAAGSWGGHAVALSRFDAGKAYFETWGDIQQASWNWLNVYGSECWVPISKEWFDAQGHAPSGFDWPTLWVDLSQVSDGHIPVPPAPPLPPGPPPVPPVPGKPTTVILQDETGHELARFQRV